MPACKNLLVSYTPKKKKKKKTTQMNKNLMQKN